MEGWHRRVALSRVRRLAPCSSLAVIEQLAQLHRLPGTGSLCGGRKHGGTCLYELSVVVLDTRAPTLIGQALVSNRKSTVRDQMGP